jgi:putative hemolysin
MSEFAFTLGILLFGAGLAILATLDRIFRELGRVTTGQVHIHLDVFEAEIEPRLAMDRRRAAITFSLLARLGLVLLASATFLGVLLFVPELWAVALLSAVYLTLEVLLFMHFIPDLLLARTSCRWLGPLVPLIRVLVILVWPFRALLELAASLARISEEVEPGGDADRRSDQEGIEALVEAAQEEGIIESEEAQLIEQVVEFSDKRVREVMTPRPDIVAIQAGASIEDLRRLLVETKFSRIPIYEDSLDDISGVVYARDLLAIPEREAAQRKVREVARQVLFVPETKLGSALMKEMQQKNQHLAIVVDEYGIVAGLATLEDLVEEIVGEIGEEDRQPLPDIVRETDGSLLLRGSVAIDRLKELFPLELDPATAEASTTVAGLLNSLAGHVPIPGERIDYDGVRFEVLEANQRKVLRLRARRHSSASAAPSA